MQWTVRLEARTSQGEVKTTELVTFNRPGVVGTLAEVGLMLAEDNTLLAKLQASMLCGQVAAYAAHRRACTACGVFQPLKDRRTRRLQRSAPTGCHRPRADRGAPHPDLRRADFGARRLRPIANPEPP